MEKDKRILICGPSGAGKTTLAEWISKTYMIPFISTSTKPLWKEYGIKSHKDLLIKNAMDPVRGIEFQHELLKYRKDKLSGIGSFISDRSPIDNLMYFLMQNAQYASFEQTNEYIEECMKSLNELATHIIYIPFINETVLEDDGKRINNAHYQLLCSNIFDYIIDKRLLGIRKKFGKRFMTINKWEWDYRMYKVNNLLKNRQLISKNDLTWAKEKLFP